MPKIRDMSSISKKWAEVTPQRAPQYEAGIRSPRADWGQATAAANDTYKAAVIDAANKDRFKAGVLKAGTARWQKGAIDKGAARFGPGVQVAEPDYAAGFAPFRDAIERTALPPRYARRDPRNIERVRVMAAALAAAKVGGSK